MAVIAAEERAQTRVLLAHHRKPARDRAVIRAFLHALGVAWTDAELAAPVEAPMDVRFGDAQFHLRELREHPRGRDGHEPAEVHQRRACTHGGAPHDRTAGRQGAVCSSRT